MLALPYTARKCERSQLRMRAISSRKHTKLKNTKIYSKGVLVNHTKISTNENIPLYSICVSVYEHLFSMHVCHVCVCVCI